MCHRREENRTLRRRFSKYVVRCSDCKRKIVFLLFLRHRYVPAQDPIEQTLTPRDDAVAKKRERKNKKDSEREKCEKEGVKRNTRKKRDRSRERGNDK